MIRVWVTGQLRDLTRGAREVKVDSAENLQVMIGELDRTFPGIGRKIVDDQGRIRTYVNVFINSENSRDLQNEKTKLRDGDTIHILPSVAGG